MGGAELDVTGTSLDKSQQGMDLGENGKYLCHLLMWKTWG